MSYLNSCLSKDEESTTSSSSESQISIKDPKILSSTRVGDRYYQLVVESSSCGEEMAPEKVPQGSSSSSSNTTKPTAQVKPTEKPKLQQRARKTFPSASNSFKIPRILGKDASNSGSDSDGKKLQQDVPKLILTSPTVNTIHPTVSEKLATKSSDASSHDHQLFLKRPAVRSENGEKSVLDPEQRKSLLNSMKQEYSASHQSTTVIDLTNVSSSDSVASVSSKDKAKKSIQDLQYIGGPPTPAPTPNKEELLMSSTVDKDIEAAMAALHGEELEEETNLISNPANVEIPIKENETSIASSSSSSFSSLVKSPRLEKKRKQAVTYASPSKLDVDKKKPQSTTGSPAKTVPKSLAKGKTAKPKSRASRELDQLFIDEGAIKIMRDMVQKGANTRRSTTLPAAKQLRSPNRHPARTSTTPKAEKNVKNNNNREQSPQDDSMGDWKQDSIPGEEKPVYVPRKVPQAAMRKRSFYPSDSETGSTDEYNPNKKAKTTEVAAGTVKTITITSPVMGVQALLHDHGYTSVKEDGVINKLSAGCQEIHIRCTESHMLHVTLTPCSSILPGSLNAKILTELTVLLRKLKTEPSVHVVLITSAGPEFCTGIDFPTLLKENMAERLEECYAMTNLIQEFIIELANCDKILVGGLNGAVIGLGCTLLPYLDVVYASDKSTFYLPYSKLAQGTEGGFPLTFNNSSRSKSLVSLLLYEGRRLTATEAHNMGLVDAVLWPSSFQEDLIPRVKALSAQSTQSSLSTKKLMRAPLRRKLANVLKEETTLLRQTWIHDEFQRRAKAVFDAGELLG